MLASPFPGCSPPCSPCCPPCRLHAPQGSQPLSGVVPRPLQSLVPVSLPRLLSLGKRPLFTLSPPLATSGWPGMSRSMLCKPTIEMCLLMSSGSTWLPSTLSDSPLHVPGSIPKPLHASPVAAPHPAMTCLDLFCLERTEAKQPNKQKAFHDPATPPPYCLCHRTPKGMHSFFLLPSHCLLLSSHCLVSAF